MVRYTPFDVRRPNGMTFSRSVDNPNSNLYKVVFYLSHKEYRGGTFATRNEILDKVFDIRVGGTTRSGGPITKKSIRGWGSNFFAGAQEAGFLKRSVYNKQTVYMLTDLAREKVLEFPTRTPTGCLMSQYMGDFDSVARWQRAISERGYRWLEITFDNGEAYIRFSKESNPLVFSDFNDPNELGWGRFPREEAWQKAFIYIVLGTRS